MSESVINRLLAQRVADVLAEYETNQSSGNGNDNGNKIYDSGSGDEGHRTLLENGSDKVEKYIGGLPYSIQGSVMASKPKMLQEAIELARSLMD
ncbi:hypothetical protein Tco_0336908 [Tanacetum coccineum]